jgi:hypothetical protein
LKCVSCVRRESDHFHSVIFQRLQCLRRYMNGTIAHKQNSFFICEILHSTVVHRCMKGL